MFRIVLFAAILGAALPKCAFSSIVFSTSFEDGNTGFTSVYTYDTTATGTSLATSMHNIRYTLTTNPRLIHSEATSFGDHTTGNGKMLAVNGEGVDIGSVWEVTVSVTPHTIYELSAFAASWTGPPQSSQYKLSELGFRVNGENLGALTAPNAVWTEFVGTWTSGAATSATMQIYESATGGPYGGTDFAIDDITLRSIGTAEVPEPASFTIFACLFGALFAMHRRSAK